MYGQIDNNFSVRALTADDFPAILEMQEYTAELLGVTAINTPPETLLARASYDNWHGFVLEHRRRGILSYREYFYPGYGPYLIQGFYLESQRYGKNASKIDYWIKEYVFPEFTTLRIQVVGNLSSAESAVTDNLRWNGKTKTRKYTTERVNGESVANNSYIMDIEL